MADPNDKLQRAYRDLAREEPPRSLDAAILAASARAVRRPSAMRRWGAPVAIAATLVLAIGVTLEMQHEQPGVETSAPERGAIPPRAAEPQPAPLPQAQVPVTPPSPTLKPVPARPTLQKQRREEAVPAPTLAPTPAAVPAPTPAPQPFPMEKRMAPAASSADTLTAPANIAPAPAAEAQTSRSAGAAASGSVPAFAPTAKSMRAISAESAELERIANLRAQGRDAEADKALEEFRRAHPGYRIPDAMWERVKPR